MNIEEKLEIILIVIYLKFLKMVSISNILKLSTTISIHFFILILNFNGYQTEFWLVSLIIKKRFCTKILKSGNIKIKFLMNILVKILNINNILTFLH